MIKRVKKTNNYTIIHNACLHDELLSAKAKGLYSYIMSLADEWEIYQRELVNHFTDGRDSISSGINELCEAGYVTKERRKNIDGKFDGWDYTFFEERQESPKPDNPTTANPQLISTNLNKGLTKDIKNIQKGKIGAGEDKIPLRPDSKKKDKRPVSSQVSKRFIKPTPEQVEEYMAEKHPEISAEKIHGQAFKFWHHHETNDWMRNRNKMKKWKSAVSVWMANDYDKVFNTVAIGGDKRLTI